MVSAAVLAATTAGIGGAAIATPPAGAATTTTITVGTAEPSSTFLPLYVAQYKGLFAKYGLKVNIVALAASIGPAALTSGSINIFEDGASALIPAIQKGTIVALGSEGFIASSIYVPASVTKLSQLQGKTVGVSVAGSATDLVTRKLLEDAGLQPGVNVQIAYIGAGAPQIAAMQNNVVGGAILPSSVYTEANQIGWHPIVNVNKSKYSGYLLSLMTANKAWVASNNKAVTNFFKAQLQARKMISNNQNLAVQAQVSVAVSRRRSQRRATRPRFPSARSTSGL